MNQANLWAIQVSKWESTFTALVFYSLPQSCTAKCSHPQASQGPTLLVQITTMLGPAKADHSSLADFECEI